MVTHKVKSLKEVYYHVTGVPNQIVQTEEEAISNQNCLQCHSKNRLVTASGDLKVNHKGHIDDGIPCITCHSGVVHAKMAARDINVTADRSKWTPENAQKLIEEKYLKPNMGTCIDCHDKVNKGEKPWKDVAYSVPPNPEEKKADTEKAKSSEGTEAAQAAHDKNTQDIILQAVGQQQKDVKVSMACETCHREIKVPKSHKIDDWKTNHGATAIQTLDSCMNCHQDSKWEKEIPKEDITTILKLGPQNSKYTPNVTVTKEEARTNKFCSACHSKRPPGHEQSNDWLTGHAIKASTPEAKAECFVCHDNAKPSPNSTDAKAPTDVYCQYCHRTGFKSDTKN
jgi:cytochrome c-type protein NapC